MQELQLFMKLGTKTLNFLEDETGQCSMAERDAFFLQIPPPSPTPTPLPPSLHLISHPHTPIRVQNSSKIWPPLPLVLATIYK
jgi:hypothetical protein